MGNGFDDDDHGAVPNKIIVQVESCFPPDTIGKNLPALVNSGWASNTGDGMRKVIVILPHDTPTAESAFSLADYFCH